MVCTIDSFQGKEADYVIVSMCAQGMTMSPHLQDRKRGCVATSGGKRRLIILGDRESLLRSRLWKEILQNIKCVEEKTYYKEAVK